MAVAPDDVALGAAAARGEDTLALRVQHREVVVVHAEPDVVVDVHGDLGRQSDRRGCQSILHDQLFPRW